MRLPRSRNRVGHLTLPLTPLPLTARARRPSARGGSKTKGTAGGAIQAHPQALERACTEACRWARPPIVRRGAGSGAGGGDDGDGRRSLGPGWPPPELYVAWCWEELRVILEALVASPAFRSLLRGMPARGEISTARGMGAWRNYMLHLLTGRMAGHTKNVRDAASVAALLHACLAGSEWLSINDILKLIHDVVGRLRRALAEEDSDDEWP